VEAAPVNAATNDVVVAAVSVVARLANNSSRIAPWSGISEFIKDSYVASTRRAYFVPPKVKPDTPNGCEVPGAAFSAYTESAAPADKMGLTKGRV
jgi:hypothetical protein